ncbi:hypothetical protein DFQ30_011462 [Apophysomyces sp. BC1015]|nr:hypothetical protein DFQ30_011462 [Apophysomyces sp. BC1015]
MSAEIWCLDHFGFGAFALYLVGIAQTLADSHRAISTGWLPPPHIVDLMGWMFVLMPVIVNTVLCVLSGALAESDLLAAERLIRYHYIMWFVHCVNVTSSVLLAGIRLVRLLNRHLEKCNASGPRYKSIKTGIFKINAVMAATCGCMMMYGIMAMVYSFLRFRIMTHTAGNITLGAIWNFLGPVTTLFVEVTIIINPKINENASLGLRSSSNESPLSPFGTAPGAAANGTLSYNALDQMKQQQFRHQKDSVPATDLPPMDLTEIKQSPIGIPLDDLDPYIRKISNEGRIERATISSQIELIDGK